MWQLFYSRSCPGRLRPAGDAHRECELRDRWRRDPLSHPAIAAMSLEQVADLPYRQLRSWCRE